MYDLLSVVIHRGGAASGHYHAYIRDLSGEGGWTEEQAAHNTGRRATANKRKAQPAAAKAEDKSSLPWDWDQEDNNHRAVHALRLILLTQPKSGVAIDNLASLFEGSTGQSWRQAYKAKEGTLTHFVKRYKAIFQVKGDVVTLQPSAVKRPAKPSRPAGANAKTKPNGPATPGSSSQGAQKTNGPAREAKEEEEKEEEGGAGRGQGGQGREACCPAPPRPHWFHFDDETVEPVLEDILSTQFGGKGSRETAYMLFYRARALVAAQSSKGKDSKQEQQQLDQNGQVLLPQHIREALQKEEQEEQEEALRHFHSVNTVGFHLSVLSARAKGLPPARRTFRMEFLRTERLRTLRAELAKRAHVAAADQIIHLRQARAKKQVLVGWGQQHDEQTLQELGLVQGCELFLQAARHKQPGLDKSVDQKKKKQSPHKGKEKDKGEKEQGKMEKQGKREKQGARDDNKEEEEEESLGAAELRRRQELRHVKVQVRGLTAQGQPLEEVQVSVFAPASATMQQLREIILEEVDMEEVRAAKEGSKEGAGGGGRLLSTQHKPYFQEDWTLQQAKISDGHVLVFEPHPRPSEAQLFLRAQLVQNGKKVKDETYRHLLVAQHATIAQCKQVVAEAFNKPTGSVLLRLDTAGSVLHEEALTLQQLQLEHASTVSAELEPLRPEGELSVQFVYCSHAGPGEPLPEPPETPNANADGQDTAENEPAAAPACPFRVPKTALSELGALVLQDEQTLLQVKQFLLSFPLLTELPSPDCLRLSELGPGDQPGRILRGNNNTLKQLKVKDQSQLVVERLAEPEQLQDKTTMLWLTERKVRTDAKQEHAVVSASNTPCQAVHVALQNIVDLPSLKRLLAPHLPEVSQFNMTVAIYNQHLYTWKELVEEAQSKRKRNRKKKKKKKLWVGAALLRDRAVIAVKAKSTDPKRKDKWRTEFDRYMSGRDTHPLYNLPPRPDRHSGAGAEGRNGISDSAILSIEVDDFDSSDSEEE